MILIKSVHSLSFKVNMFIPYKIVKKKFKKTSLFAVVYVLKNQKKNKYILQNKKNNNKNQTNLILHII